MIRATKIVTVIAVGVGVLFFVLAIGLAGVTLVEASSSLWDDCRIRTGRDAADCDTGLGHGYSTYGRRHALIKRLSAVETLGCTTVSVRIRPAR